MEGTVIKFTKKEEAGERNATKPLISSLRPPAMGLCSSRLLTQEQGEVTPQPRLPAGGTPGPCLCSAGPASPPTPPRPHPELPPWVCTVDKGAERLRERIQSRGQDKSLVFLKMKNISPYCPLSSQELEPKPPELEKNFTVSLRDQSGSSTSVKYAVLKPSVIQCFWLFSLFFLSKRVRKDLENCHLQKWLK